MINKSLNYKAQLEINSLFKADLEQCFMCNLYKIKQQSKPLLEPRFLAYSKNFLLLNGSFNKQELEILRKVFALAGLNLDDFSIGFAAHCALNSSAKDRAMCAGNLANLITQVGAKNVLTFGAKGCDAFIKASEQSIIKCLINGSLVKFVITYELATLLKSEQYVKNCSAFIRHLRI